MSSPKSPRSPSLSPTADLEQSFFQVLAFRSSDQFYPINSSEASSPISPMTQQTETKRPQLRGRSEASHVSQNAPIVESTSFAALSIPLSEFVLRGSPLLKVTKPSEAGISNPTDSRSSSVSIRARNLLRSWSPKASVAAIDAELQQDAKIGRNKKRELSRHWPEIRNRRKMKSDGQSRTNSEDSPFATPIQHTSRTSEATPKGNPTMLKTSHRHDEPVPLEPHQQKSLFNQAKHRLGLGRESNDSAHKNDHTTTFTGELLERATIVLRELSDKMMTSPSPTTSGSNKSSRSTLSWHTHRRRVVPFLYSIRNSSSSSTYDAIMGKAPQVSPNPQAMYTGSDSKKYLRVEISNPDGPSYLPSEARRIGTPPTPDSMPGKRLRGFFFDYNAPHEANLGPGPETVEGRPLPSRDHKKRAGGVTDWYRVKLAADEAKDAQYTFELDVPDHLPSSPLCPKHPKHHRTGGKGVCPYHGRNKALSLEE